MSSGLVWIGKIVLMAPIPNADRVVRVEVVCGKGGRWSAVVGKDQFRMGDLARVYLQDSLLPDIPEFEFMRPRGHRVRMARFLGVASEALCMPIPTHEGKVGTDITEAEGVTKYEKPLPTSIDGEIAGHFPAFIPKTDEPNWQTVPEMLDALTGKPWVATVKVDGTSTTCYWYDGHFGVCSRNYELRETPGNAAWQLVRKYSLADKLPILGQYALQWETYGPGIQGNPTGAKELSLALFSVYDIARRVYLPHVEVEQVADILGVPTVLTAYEGPEFNPDPDHLRSLAEGTYPNGKQREGVVIRPWFGGYLENKPWSFKVINLKYKD